MVRVRVRRDHIFAGKVHRSQLAIVRAIHHLVIVQADLRGQCHAPGLLELTADLVVRDRLIAGEVVRHCAHVAGALNVVMTAQRIGAATGLHVVPCRQQQVANRR